MHSDDSKLKSARVVLPKRSPFATYVTGFVLSIILTLAAYFSVTNHIIAGPTLIACLLVLAVAQLLVQLLFFLHMGSERKPRYNLMIFGFTVLILLTVVVGTLWIMKNLNYNMQMSPSQTDLYMRSHEGL